MTRRWLCRASHPSANVSPTPGCAEEPRCLPVPAAASFGFPCSIPAETAMGASTNNPLSILPITQEGKRNASQANRARLARCDFSKRKNPPVSKGQPCSWPWVRVCAGPAGAGEDATRWQWSTVPWPAPRCAAGSACLGLVGRTEITSGHWTAALQQQNHKCEIQIRSNSKILVSSDALF